MAVVEPPGDHAYRSYLRRLLDRMADGELDQVPVDTVDRVAERTGTLVDGIRDRLGLQ